MYVCTTTTTTTTTNNHNNNRNSNNTHKVWRFFLELNLAHMDLPYRDTVIASAGRAQYVIHNLIISLSPSISLSLYIYTYVYIHISCNVYYIL